MLIWSYDFDKNSQLSAKLRKCISEIIWKIPVGSVVFCDDSYGIKLQRLRGDKCEQLLF